MSAVLEKQANASSRGQTVATVSIDPAAEPQVVPEDLSVRCATVIHFQLSESARKAWEFATAQPIVVPSDPTFPEPPVRRSDSLVTLKDAFNQMGSFKYSINLIDRKTGQPYCIDPQITNED